MRKIDIIAHRGAFFPEAPIPTISHYEIAENTLSAFERAFKNGWGVETDIRIIDGQIVLTHDIHRGRQIPTLKQFCGLVKKYTSGGNKPFIAFQLKSSNKNQAIIAGQAVASVIKQYELKESILFDATLEVAKKLRKEFPQLNLSVSVGEKNYSPTIYTPVQVLTSEFTQIFNGVWVDEWKESTILYNKAQLKKLKSAFPGRVDIVSPELHYIHKHPQAFDLEALKFLWEEIISWEIADGICTDYPSQIARI